jgi:diguanylate cyclase (GGDEF)-like protein/PAS domain S-box-containing protein
MGFASRFTVQPTKRRLVTLTDPTWWVIGCGATLIAAIIIGATLIVRDFRERAIDRSKAELDNASQLLAQHFDRHFDEISAAERFVAGYVERITSSPDEFTDLLTKDTFHTLLREQVEASADKSSRIGLFDQDGSLIASSEDTPPSVSISDRKYFDAIKGAGSTANAIPQVELVDSHTHKDKRVVVARGIYTNTGRFLGVVTRSIAPVDLERFLSSTVRNDRSTLLVSVSSGIIASYPSDALQHGPTLLQSSAVRRLVASNDHLAQPATALTDDHTIVSIHWLANYPLVVVAAMKESAALASWRDETRILIIVASLAALVTGIMLIVVVRYLNEQTRRLDVAISNMPQALLLFDASERLIVKNKQFSELFGNTEQPAIGDKFKDLVSDCRRSGRSSSVDIYFEGVQEALRLKRRTQRILRLPDGRFLQIVSQALDNGGWVSTIDDITERRRAEELTVRLARYDSLTGLPNRASFLEHLRQQLCRKDVDGALAVLFVDLDDFKTVNDTLGHHVGDDLLRSVALRLKHCVKSSEFVARLGGDEFAFTSWYGANRGRLLDLVQKIHDAARCVHECVGHSLTIDASIGIAIAPYDGDTCDSILQSADLAMYAAKAQGKKSYRFFDQEMEAKARERLALERELRRALANGEIETHFQPILDLHKGQIVTCEALARWPHLRRDYVSPEVFIPIAEQAGLIGELGEIVLRQACRSAAAWPNNISVAVNVSPLQLKNPAFSLKVLSILNETQLAATRLEIEITEAVLIGDDETARKILHELRSIGVRVALDDFGTGYSSLSYLLRFPFDKVKIDRCFIDGLCEQDVSRGIVRGAIAMASELHMVVTAEGVANKEQCEMLSKLHCDQIQGHLIAPAQTSREIAEFLSRPIALTANS